MKVLITGGHMVPALAVIQALPKDIDVVYVGRKYAFEGDRGESLEFQTITKLGIPFIPLVTGRLQRVITPYTIQSLLKIPQGIWQARNILRKEKPDIVLGFGGYLSFPVGLAAKLANIPFIIHEQTLKAGMANAILARFATKICVSWEESTAFFPKGKVVCTGNPLLPFDKKITIPLPKGKFPLLVIVGGSAGSHAINELVYKALPHLLKDFRVFHQTGDAKVFGDYDKLQEAKKHLSPSLQERYTVVKFIPPEDMWGVLDSADGVVSRSGINTVTMLLVLQKKSLLIPLPFGQKNEQLENALLLEKEGLGMVLDQHTASPESFVKAVISMMEMKPENREKIKEKAAFHLSAAGRIAEIVQICAKTASKNGKTV